MSAHAISLALLLAFVLAMVALLRFIHSTGRQVLPVTALWGLLVGGYLLIGARFVQTMEAVEWIDGLVGFVALCSALPLVSLIRRVCPSCRRRLHLGEEVVTRPTRRCPGVGAMVWSCPHCGHHHVESHTIPPLAETAAEAVPWAPNPHPEPGCFGGQHSAGDGGGAGWRSTPPRGDASQ